ncbi:MAG: M1 family peptidase, partial [Bacteroidota bacterium]|nr:M1 family peptidase [Bacteroidota bacterium]
MASCFLLSAFAQTATPVSKFNPKALFDLQFYPNGGNEFRSANGTPGPKYWQNRADYKLNVTLDTTQHKVSGEVEITYTNNSPDALNYLWLQVDQNIYRKDSRSSGTTAPAGGRFANVSFLPGAVIKSISVEVDGKKFTPEYTVTDTRLQVWLKEALKASGNKAKINIDYEFIVPEYGT